MRTLVRVSSSPLGGDELKYNTNLAIRTDNKDARGSKTKDWANYHWAIITDLKGGCRVFERILKMTRKTVLNHIKQA